MTERDDTVSKHYRELPAEEPPRALDEAILAASRRAVHTHPAPLVAPAGRQRWYVPLAAAAVIVLAVGLTLRVQLERPEVVEEVVTSPSPAVLKAPMPKNEVKSVQKFAERKAAEESPRAEKPAPERRARQAAPEAGSREKLGESASGTQSGAAVPSPFPEQRAAPAPKSYSQREDAERRAMRAAEAPAAAEPKPSVAAAPPPPPAAKPAPQAPAAAQMRTAPAPASRADDASRDRAESRALASGATAKRQMEAEETPEKALERIAELRKAGKHDEADKALAEFRKRHPEYTLSDEMKAKVERAPAR